MPFSFLQTLERSLLTCGMGAAGAVLGDLVRQFCRFARQ
jgi:hypothetical protein